MWERNLFRIFSLSVFFILVFGFRVFCLVGNNKIILIDPGHGGIDGGAVSSKTFEKDLNLQISLKLREILERRGYKVFMTRESDICLCDKGSIKEKKRGDLNKRCEMKREVNCDLFLSIHMNKFPDASVKGSQVWYPYYSEKSKRVAFSLSKMFEEVLNQKRREPKGVKNDYVILRDGYEGASVIVECGFISNKEEEEKLKDTSYQNLLCEAIVKGIEEYFNGGSLN